MHRSARLARVLFALTIAAGLRNRRRAPPGTRGAAGHHLHHAPGGRSA